jgi:hypothetical protein
MDSTYRQDQLETVSALAASLADRMLMERLTSGTLPLANASRLWTASLLLEEHEQPIPSIVADVLQQFRPVEPADDRDDPGGLDGPDPDAGPDAAAEEATALGRAPRKGRLTRLLRPFRQAADA